MTSGSSKKILIAGATVIVLAYIAIFFFVYGSRNTPGVPGTQSNTTSSTTISVAPPEAIFNAFIPPQVNPPMLFPQGNTSGAVASGNGNQPPIGEVFQTPKTIQQIENLVTSQTPIATSQGNILPLPEVQETEIAVDPQGASSTLGYLEYFAAHAGEIHFAYNRFDTMIKNDGGIPLLPPELIDKAIKENNFSQIKSSLEAYQDFLNAKIDYMKLIKVAATEAAFNKVMIGIDRLTLSLIEKALAQASKSSSDESFLTFFNDYKKTVFSYNLTTRNEVSRESNGTAPSFAKVLAPFGLGNVVHAQFNPFNFGGMTYYTLICTCGFGMLVTVGQPKAGVFYLSWATYASPAIFMYKSVRPGSYVLGLYTPSPIPCMQVGVPSCWPSGFAIGMMTMAGTSP